MCAAIKEDVNLPWDPSPGRRAEILDVSSLKKVIFQVECFAEQICPAGGAYMAILRYASSASRNGLPAGSLRLLSITSFPDTDYPDSCHEAILPLLPPSFNGGGLPN